MPGIEKKKKKPKINNKNDLMGFIEKTSTLTGKKKINCYSHFSSQDSHMTRQHYISHKQLGSAHSPALQLVGDGE